MVVSGGLFDLAEREHIQMPETVVYVIVNAQAGGRHDWSKKQSLPSIASVLGSISSVGIYRYNFETIELLREEAAEWSKQAARHGKRLNTYVVEVAFDHLEDPAERAFFNDVETSMNLDDATIDRLIEVGGRLLRESPDFQKFLTSLK